MQVPRTAMALPARDLDMQVPLGYGLACKRFRHAGPPYGYGLACKRFRHVGPPRLWPLLQEI